MSSVTILPSRGQWCFSILRRCPLALLSPYSRSAQLSPGRLAVFEPEAFMRLLYISQPYIDDEGSAPAAGMRQLVLWEGVPAALDGADEGVVIANLNSNAVCVVRTDSCNENLILIRSRVSLPIFCSLPVESIPWRSSAREFHSNIVSARLPLTLPASDMHP